MMQVYLYNLHIALQAIAQNRLRSLLTSLGIIFGVGSVIAMLAIGSGAQQEILDQMKILGTNNVIINSVIEQEEGEVNEEDKSGKQEKKRFSPGLSLKDVQSIKAAIPGVESVTPEIIFETMILRSGYKRTGKLVGVDPSYFDINGFNFMDGNAFSTYQVEHARPVCVIGNGVKTRFFAGEDPIGKQIKCGALWLTVVGVLEEKTISSVNRKNLGIRDYNMDIYVPATTMLIRYKNRSLVTEKAIKNAAAEDEAPKKVNANYHQVDKMIVRVKETTQVGTIAEIISRMLARRHNEVVDFEVVVPEMLLKQEQRTKTIFNIVLSSIASISLLVGGIGIMNIMFASVVERYKEIGTRMAIGARKMDIVLQFLTEALVISLAGGCIGIMVGVGFSYLIESAAGIKTIVTPFSVVISFGVALATGLLFGIFPAKRAADQEPANALRYE